MLQICPCSLPFSWKSFETLQILYQRIKCLKQHLKLLFFPLSSRFNQNEAQSLSLTNLFSNKIAKCCIKSAFTHQSRPYQIRNLQSASSGFRLYIAQFARTICNKLYIINLDNMHFPITWVSRAYQTPFKITEKSLSKAFRRELFPFIYAFTQQNIQNSIG
jgi:hypothetical protein